MSKMIMLFFGVFIVCSCNNTKNQKLPDADSTEKSTSLPPEDNHVMENNVTTQRRANVDNETLKMRDSVNPTKDYLTLADTAMAISLDSIVKK